MDSVVRSTLSRRLAVLGLVAITALLALPGGALAVEPTKTEFAFSDTIVLTDLCDFAVTVTNIVSGTETDFVDQSGALTKILAHVVEQDTFSANGKTLVGLPLTFNVEVFFDSSGAVTGAFASGVAERIPLPDGSHVLLAGRIDFSLHPGAVFVIVPDMGTPGDFAGFCAALAP